jgi:putative membrane protein
MALETGCRTVVLNDCSERDRLALERTNLANERTLLSYIRTAIMLFATGASIVKIFPSSVPFVISGFVLVGLSLFTFGLGAARFRRMKHTIIGTQTNVNNS